MGIYASMAKIIIQNAPVYGYAGKALTLGVQHFNYTDAECSAIFREMNQPERRGAAPVLNTRLKNLRPEVLDAREFFTRLGYDAVEELDYDAYEGCSIVHDMNTPVPKELYGRYDLVFDGGTLEHIFDVRTAMENVTRLVKVGGLVLHAMPLSGWVNHGFYQFCPSLAYQYYRQNGFNQIRGYVLRVNRVLGARAYVRRITNFDAEDFRFNDFACKTLFMIFARKETAVEPRVPIQQRYADIYVQSPGEKAPVAGGPAGQALPRRHRLALGVARRFFGRETFAHLYNKFAEKAAFRAMRKEEFFETL